MADDDDGLEVMRLGAQRAPLVGSQGVHGAKVYVGKCAMPLNPSGKKHRFGKAWMHEHVNDPYVKEAQRRGYRSRAAFKLIELDATRPAAPARHARRRPGRRAGQLDAGAARAGSAPAGEIVAIDLLPMDPIARRRPSSRRLSRGRGPRRGREQRSADEPVDLVVSDMAPNLSGIDRVDQARSVHLGELALEFALSTGCNPAATLSSKSSRATGLRASSSGRLRRTSPRFTCASPKASRDRSREVFLVGKGFIGRRGI